MPVQSTAYRVQTMKGGVGRFRMADGGFKRKKTELRRGGETWLKKEIMKKLLILLVFILPGMLFSQQIADTSYHPEIENPEYEPGKGPVVFIDEGHHNFHTKEGRYKAFSNLLERDGYKVKEYKGQFNEKKLSEGKILVISNALHRTNVRKWYLPVSSAFTGISLDSTVTCFIKRLTSLLLPSDRPKNSFVPAFACYTRKRVP